MTAPTVWNDTLLTYAGNDGRPVHRPARIVRTRDTLWVIATETGAGLTLPNGIEAVWRTIRRRWPDEVVRLIVHTPPSRGTLAPCDKWEEAVEASPGSSVVWYTPWPETDMVLLFGHDVVPFPPAHQPIAPAAAQQATAVEYERRRLAGEHQHW